MKDAVSELQKNVSVPFEQARAMPTSVYTSQDFLQRELENIFSKDWFCVGRASSLSKPGDYLTLDLAEQPIVVLRDSEGQLKAMSNVCLHRMSTLLEGRGNARSIVCPYHAWTYNLDGSLRGAPAMTLNDGFCKSQYKLPQIRCEEWLGWVFVTLNLDATSTAKEFAKVEDLVGDYDMTSYTERIRIGKFSQKISWRVIICPYVMRAQLAVCQNLKK